MLRCALGNPSSENHQSPRIDVYLEIRRMEPVYVRLPFQRVFPFDEFPRQWHEQFCLGFEPVLQVMSMRSSSAFEDFVSAPCRHLFELADSSGKILTLADVHYFFVRR